MSDGSIDWTQVLDTAISTGAQVGIAASGLTKQLPYVKPNPSGQGTVLSPTSGPVTTFSGSSILVLGLVLVAVVVIIAAIAR